MSIFNTPGNDNPVTTGETKAVTTSLANTPSNNKALFTGIAELVSPEMMKDSGIRRGITEKALTDRVVDLPITPNVMKSAKLNLTSNGALLISLNDGNQVFNHPVTNAERGKLNNIINNPNLTDDAKIEKMQYMLTAIGLSTKLSNNFEQNYQQNQSLSASIHR